MAASQRRFTAPLAAVAALVLATGVVAGVGAMVDDGDALEASGIDVEVAGETAGDGETTESTAGHSHDDSGHSHDASDPTHDHDSADGTHDHADGTHDHSADSDSDPEGSDADPCDPSTDPDPEPDGHGHVHRLAVDCGTDPGPDTDPSNDPDPDPDPCHDHGHQHMLAATSCPDPDPDPDPDPCDDHGHQHALAAKGCPDPDPDPDPDECDGHVHTADPTDPCNPDPCDDHHHDHAVAAPAGATDPTCEPDPCLADPAAEGCTDPCDPNAHHHDPACPDDVVQYDDLPAETRALIDEGTAVALQFPTSAAASAGGWPQITVYFPGIAQHNLKNSILDATFDPAQPEVLLYGKDGQLVGINYIVFNAGGPPEGFPGDADHWHEHPSLCLNGATGLIVGGENLSRAECAALGGVVIGFQNFWLLHVWTIPGWDSPEGVFSHENSRV